MSTIKIKQEKETLEAEKGNDGAKSKRAKNKASVSKIIKAEKVKQEPLEQPPDAEGSAGPSVPNNQKRNKSRRTVSKQKRDRNSQSISHIKYVIDPREIKCDDVVSRADLLPSSSDDESDHMSTEDHFTDTEDDDFFESPI